MMWDANRAFANVDASGVHYAQAAKNALAAAVGSGSTGATVGKSSKSVAVVADTSVAGVATSAVGVATSVAGAATPVPSVVGVVTGPAAIVDPAVATGSPVFVSTTLKTVTVKTVSHGMGAPLAVEKNRIATYALI
jgi:hypothetical protein